MQVKERESDEERTNRKTLKFFTKENYYNINKRQNKKREIKTVVRFYVCFCFFFFLQSIDITVC